MDGGHKWRSSWLMVLINEQWCIQVAGQLRCPCKQSSGRLITGPWGGHMGYGWLNFPIMGFTHHHCSAVAMVIMMDGRTGLKSKHSVLDWSTTTNASSRPRMASCISLTHDLSKSWCAFLRQCLCVYGRTGGGGWRQDALSNRRVFERALFIQRGARPPSTNSLI